MKIFGQQKNSRQKIWSVKNLVTCPKFSHFLPTFFLPIRYNAIVSYISNTLDMSRKTLQTSRTLSSDLYILCVIYNSWFIQESPGLKPN